jgi:hypothetical protein
MKVKVLKIEGRKVTVELPTGAKLGDNITDDVIELTAGNGEASEEATDLTDEQKALAETEEYPEPKTELARALIESLKAARKAYVEGGGKFLNREELDDLYDEMRGRK